MRKIGFYFLSGFLVLINAGKLYAQTEFNYGYPNAGNSQDTIEVPFEVCRELMHINSYIPDIALIRNEEDLKKVLVGGGNDTLGFGNIPQIDFSKHSLFLLSTHYSNDETINKTFRRIYYVPFNQTLGYNVTIEQQVPHEKDVPNFNWVKIPKFPDDVKNEYYYLIRPTLSPVLLKDFNRRFEQVMFKDISKKTLEEKITKADTGKIEIPFLPFPTIGNMGNRFERTGKLLIVDSYEKLARLVELDISSFPKSAIRVRQPDINFDKFILIGYFTPYKTEEPYATTHQHVYFDAHTKELVYDLSIVNRRISAVFSPTYTWILLPKLMGVNKIITREKTITHPKISQEIENILKQKPNYSKSNQR